MTHANIIDGQYVDDDLQPVDGPEFEPPVWLTPTFKEAIEQLASQRDYVPYGWRRLFDETLVKLQAVCCPQRNGIELSEIAFGRGEMVVAAQGGGQGHDYGSDRVVQGILNRLRQASAVTCTSCSTRLGVAYRRDCFTALCDRCHVHEQLDQVIDDLINEDSAYTEVPLVECDALPPNIQAIIPEDQIKTVYLKTLDVHIRYVEPKTLRGLKPQLRVLKQALVAARGG
jgi:hypothetical protein